MFLIYIKNLTDPNFEWHTHTYIYIMQLKTTEEVMKIHPWK